MCNSNLNCSYPEWQCLTLVPFVCLNMTGVTRFPQQYLVPAHAWCIHEIKTRIQIWTFPKWKYTPSTAKLGLKWGWGLWSVFSMGQSFCSYPQHTSGNGSFAYSLRSSSTSGEPIAPRASPACKRKHCKSKWCLLRLHNLHVCNLWKLSQNL